MLPKTIEFRDKRVFLVDQTRIPYDLEMLEIKSLEDMYQAIQTMVVRGAPAIGVSAAAGMALFIEALEPDNDFKQKIKKAGDYLKTSRPTAVNLMWAVDQVSGLAESIDHLAELKEKIWPFVRSMAEDDERINRTMGHFGADLFKSKGKVSILTHCNAGSLATVYWGTALGVIRELFQRGQISMVYADETRPRLQGGKITVWELLQDQIPVTVLTDNMAAHMMKKGAIDAVVVGADRIAGNGDAANKIGTYGVAILAKYHQIPFYVAAPVSTIDPTLEHGELIPIENRDPEEVTHLNGVRFLPEGMTIVNPAFDVTPAELIAGIITEKGVLQGNLRVEIERLFA